MEEPADTQDDLEAPENAEAEEEDRAGRLFHDLQIVRGALVIIASGVLVGFFYFARAILVPVVLAIFLAYVLNPLVEWTCRLRIPKTEVRMPRPISVAAVVMLTAAVTGALGFLLADQMRQLGMEVPQYSERIARDVSQIRTRVLETQEKIEQMLEPIRREAAERFDGVPPESDGEISPSTDAPPQIEAPPESTEPRRIIVRSGSDLWERISPFLAGGLTGLVGFAVQGLTVVFVLFFVLMQAPAVKKKVLHIVGTNDRRREAALDAMEDINRDLQGYLFGRFLINAGLAVAIALSFFVYGLKYALLLGIIGGLLNFIPYFGAVVGMLIAAVIAYMQFGTFSATLTTTVIYFVLTSIEGNLLTPIALSRQLQLNSLAVLLGLIFWGWLWGAIGMLLAIPILAVMRVVAEHVDDLEPLAEVLRG